MWHEKRSTIMKGLECIVNGCSYHKSSGNCHTLTFRKWMSDDVALPENTMCIDVYGGSFGKMNDCSIIHLLMYFVFWKKSSPKKYWSKKIIGHSSKIPLKPVMKNSPFSTSGPQGCHSGVRLCRVFPLGSSAGLMQVRIKDGGFGRRGGKPM